MSETVPPFQAYTEAELAHLVTEDDTPVESFRQHKQMDILVEALRVSWSEGRPFLAGADVGIFHDLTPGVAPDVLLSVGVTPRGDDEKKSGRSYFVWLYGKPPDVVIEYVSKTKGAELTHKRAVYELIKVPYYVVYDPYCRLGKRKLRIFRLNEGGYVEKVDRLFPELGLGLTLWEGEFDSFHYEWLRWTRPDGSLLALGTEYAQQAAFEKARADEERRKRELLEARLRELGVDPDGPG